MWRQLTYMISLQAVLEEVVAGSATSVADDSAELDTSEVEVGRTLYTIHYIKQFYAYIIPAW